ncbi:hypothetical protein [Bacillus sp. ISL-7]|uniref:GAP1-N2 domain-containing protein n=1 Tax=Bacillus sp. ISL-7 TaxID=2819136 RepID=UPI001BE79805|nr:hypothetical protein [Bacillus sp. ISL-7]MBT2734707.1 hypothetical protein [Bacillus sp. ISL-7]
MTGKLIQQQMYTRERGGIFLSTDGYDTIAISEGLDKSFVKKYLHPFCIYQSPKALTTRGEKDSSLYPETVTLFQPETGDMVIGQSVFVPADFTGQRSAYFMHNYVLPSNRKEEWIKHPEKLFRINDFQTSYKTEQGHVLPALEETGYDDMDVLAGKDTLLGNLGIREEQFKQLLFAVMSSIAGKKKVFISLNIPLQEYSKAALQLLELVYLYLPYAHRRKLGAMTFSSEPESKNYIHVMFYEPGTLNMNDRSIEKQFIFDFANDRISGLDISGQKHEYLDFALDHFSQSKRMDDFFAFAETALSGITEEQKLEVASYYQLTSLYQTLNSHDDSLYNDNKLGFLNSLQKFLQVNSDEKQPLIELFLKILAMEKYAGDPATALDYIHAVVSINQVVRSDEALSFILETLNYYQNAQLFHKLWKLVEQDNRSYKAILMFINEHPNYDRLLELYLDERFNRIIRVEDILCELKSMLGSPYLLAIEKFKSVVITKIEASLKQESNAFTAVLAIKDFKVDMADKDFLDFKQKMFGRSVWVMLDHIRPKELTAQDIMTFGKIFNQPINPRDMKDGKAKDNYLMTDALYQVLSMPSQASPNQLKSLSRLGRELVRENLQQLLRVKVTTEHIPVLNIAFGSEHGEVDYGMLFKHLIQYGDDKTMMAFIKDHSNLVGIDLPYRSALRSYLVSDPKSIWRNKKYNKELKLIRKSSFKNFLKEVETETASPLVKFFKKYGVKLLIIVVVLGGAGGAAWFGVDYYSSKHSTKKVASTPAVKKNVKKAENVVSLDQFKKLSDKKVDGEIFRLPLDGKQFEKIVGQAQGVTLTDRQEGNFQLDLKTETEASPFENGQLKGGFSLVGTEYDFDPADNTSEVVIVSKNHSGESYLWVFSTNTGLKGTAEPLEPIFKAVGITDVRMDNKKLTLLQGENEVANEFPFTDQISDSQE